MNLRRHPYLLFPGLGMVCSIVCTFGADVTARMATGMQSMGVAVREHLYYAGKQPAGTIWLLTPFLLVGWISASLAKEKSLPRALAVFSVGALALGIMYFLAFDASEAYMQRSMWTASTLVVGLLPIKSIPILLACLALRWFLAKATGIGDTDSR